jgi:hypothetical protein
MNSQNPFVSAMIAIGGVLAGLFVVLSVLLSHGNSLAHLCFYLLIGGGILGLLAPRAAFFAWIVACGYTDLLKRLTIVFGEVSKQDLLYILGITPVMFSGIVASLVVGGLTGAYSVRMKHWMLFLIGVLMMIVTGVAYAIEAGGSLMSPVQGIANGGLFSLLLFVVPVLFPHPEQMLKILRFTLWAFLPMALYGIMQKVDGFQPFEIAYLRTNLSVEIKQLFTDRVRAFSTLNSPTALGAISAAMMVVCWFLRRLPRAVPHQGRRWLGLLSATLLMLSYAGALIASTSRSAPLVVVLGLLAGWCFLSPGRTRAFYGLALGGFLALIIASPWLLSHLEEVNTWVTSDAAGAAFSGDTASILTYSDRLFGFANVLRNPVAYSWFGRWNGDIDTLPRELYHHDLLSSALLRFGVLPLALFLVVIARVMSGLHGKLYPLADHSARRLMAMAIGLASGFVFLSALSGNVLTVFPVNVFFWLSAAAAITCTLPLPKAAPPRAVRSTGLDLESLAGRTPGAHRFSPSQATTS